MEQQLDRLRLIEGSILCVIGIVILIAIPTQISTVPQVQSLASPALIPIFVAVGLIVLGLVMSVLAFFSKIRETPASFTREGTIRVAGAILLLFAYTILFSVIGFVVTSVVFFAIYSYIFGSRNMVKTALAAVIISILVWLLFEYVFRVPLPHGILF